jgi:predicted AAA+ superfamily ATPase
MRFSRDLAYARTPSGFEVDFVATNFEGHRDLVQVAADISSPAAFEREVKGLTGARQKYPNARLLLLSETEPPHGVQAPSSIEIVPVWQWLVGR